MDDDELAALRQRLLAAVVEADRADGRMRDLAHVFRLEEDRRRAEEERRVAEHTPAPVYPIRPDDAATQELEDDDDQLRQLRQAHAGYHIWRNGEGWHAVKDAWSDPLNAPTGDDLDRLLGPADPA